MKRLVFFFFGAAIFLTSCEKEKGGIDVPCSKRAPLAITVHVQDYSFVPNTVNAIPGDTIKWLWMNGFHTTTSTSTPPGAAAWDAPIDDNSPSDHTFTYIVPLAGTYNYQCTIHGSSMSGTIIATETCP